MVAQAVLGVSRVFGNNLRASLNFVGGRAQQGQVLSDLSGCAKLNYASMGAPLPLGAQFVELTSEPCL